MSFFETEKEVKKENTFLWVEQYRPSNLDEYIGNDHLKDTMQSYLDSNDLPHLLFYGKAGGGKTTMARILVDNIDCDHIIINASDENNVDTIRNKVKGFASTVGFKDLKVIILDEFDYMTPNAQAILRNMMETFSKHCRFILTCNHIEKVIDPIQSRCQTFQIVPPTKKEVAKHAWDILNKEGKDSDLADIVKIVDAKYPDIRKILNECQSNSRKGKLVLQDTSLVGNDVKEKIVDVLAGTAGKDLKFKIIRQLVADSRIQDFSEMYRYLFDKVDVYGKANISNVILMLSEGQHISTLVPDQEIPFMATIIQIIDVL